MGEVAPEAVELPHHEQIARPQGAQTVLESRPIVAHAGGEVVVDARRVDAHATQGVARCRSSDWEPSALETRG